jgi:hypothetical protein
MANEIISPILNPLRFIDAAYTRGAQYAFDAFDNGFFKDHIQEWEQPVDYYQPWCKSDIIKLQFQANYDPIQVEVQDRYGIAHIALSAIAKKRNTYQTDYFVYEVAISLASLPTGYYQVVVKCGSPTQKTLLSEILYISDEINNTVLLEYQNSSFYCNVLFETGIKFSYRVQGSIHKFTPSSKDVVYQDQVLNQTVLSSRPFRQFKMSIGGATGVPDWVIDKLNFIFGCNQLSFDGKPFAKGEGSKWDANEENGRPTKGWTLDIVEAVRRDSVRFLSEGDNTKKLMVVHNVESKGFGDVSNESNNVVPVTEIE